MGKNKIGIILIILLLIILLFTISFGFFFIFKKINNQNQQSDNVEFEQQIDVEDITLFSLTDSIYTNLFIGEDGREHVIKLSVNFGLDSSKKKAKESQALMTTLTEKEAIVKDVIIGILRSETYEELIRVDTQEVLKEKILTEIQKEFNTDLIVKVYINDLVLQ